jgi:hypothetical protein
MPFLEWQQHGKLIDSLRDDLLDADEPKTLRKALPRGDFDDPTDVMRDLPRVDEDGEIVSVVDLNVGNAAEPPRAARILSVTAPTAEAAPVAAPAPRPIILVSRSGLPARASMSSMDTSLLTLAPGFVDALKNVAPKKRRSAVPYVFGLAVAAIVGAIAADFSTRDFVVQKVQDATAALGF